MISDLKLDKLKKMQINFKMIGEQFNSNHLFGLQIFGCSGSGSLFSSPLK